MAVVLKYSMNILMQALIVSYHFRPHYVFSYLLCVHPVLVTWFFHSEVFCEILYFRTSKNLLYIAYCLVFER
jgi:hypothetical protein